MRLFSKTSTAKATQAVATAGILLCTGMFSEPSAALETPKVVRGVLILEGKIESGDYLTVRNFLKRTVKFQKNDWRSLSRLTRRKCF